MENENLSYRPSAYYFRLALRATDNPEQLREIGFAAVRELEHLKQWIRTEHNLIPPKKHIMLTELYDKPWLIDQEVG